MAIIQRKTVKFDGEEVVVTLKFNHWLPRFLKVGGIAVGKTSYYPRLPHETALIVVAHELLHNYDFYKKTKRMPGGYFFDVIYDKFFYLIDWVKAGFRYRKHKEEDWAYGQEDEVLMGTFEGIEALWISNRFKAGYQALPKLSKVKAK